MNGKVFISYRWTEPSGSIVNNFLKPSFHQAGINCLIDKDDCGYNANIDKFEAELPLAAKVVLVLRQNARHRVQRCLVHPKGLTNIGFAKSTQF